MIDWERWYRFQKAMPLWQWALVIGGVCVAIWLIIRLKSYFREDADVADQSMEMLTQFRDLHQEGGLSDDEFRLIRSRLASTAKGALTIERTRQMKKPVDPGSLISNRSPDNDSRDLPAGHATAKDDANSERMTEDGTD